MAFVCMKSTCSHTKGAQIEVRKVMVGMSVAHVDKVLAAAEHHMAWGDTRHIAGKGSGMWIPIPYLSVRVSKSSSGEKTP